MLNAMTESKKPTPLDLDSLKKSEAAAGCVMAARNALRKGDRERAKSLVKEAFGHQPGDIAALDFLGDLLLEDGETEQALQLFERARKAHPDYAPFEEKLAMCRLDLAEIEADKQMRHDLRHNLILGDERSKIFERSMAKALTLSLILPGAGQFYNDENEKGTVYLVAGIVSSIASFYPLWSALSRLPKAQRLDFGMAIRSMSGLESVLFYLGSTAWSGVYAASLVAAVASVKRYNEQRRALLGL